MAILVNMMNVTTISMNPMELSDLEAREILTKMSAHYSQLFLPVSIYMGILSFVGFMGNLLVLIIYTLRYKRTFSTYFIITMAIYDFMACSIVIPIDIYDVVNHFTFYSSGWCKTFRFLENLVTSGSSFVLITIAYDRYRKICRPLSMVKRKSVKLTCIITFVLAIIFAMPAPIMFGTKRSSTGIQGLKGYDCSIEEQFRRSLMRKVYYPILFFIFILTVILLICLYARVWYEIKRRKRTSIGENSSGSGICIGVDKNNQIENEKNKTFRKGRSVSEDSSSVFSPKVAYARSISQVSTRSRLASLSEALKPSKTTKIFSIVAIAFIISFLPTISIQVAFLTNKSLATAPKSVLVFLKLLSRSHYLNNAVNPFIYSFINVNFRRHCCKLWSDMLNFRKRIIERRKFSTSKSSYRKRNVGSRSDSLKSNPKSDTNKTNNTNDLDMDVFVAPPMISVTN